MRVKTGVTRSKKHKGVKRAVKGMGHGRRRSYRMGKQAKIKAMQYSYRDRRNRKRDFRRLWITRISAAAKAEGTNYRDFMAGLKKAGVTLNRKVLSEIAAQDNKAFKELVKTSKK